MHKLQSNTRPRGSARAESRRPSGRLLRGGLAALGALALAGGVPVQPYADLVVSTVETSFGFGAPHDMLGAPTGTGTVQSSSHVYAPGKGGSVILRLGLPVFDGPGADLVVYENPFTKIGTLSGNWVEALYVEVSSDGGTFARFPSKYLGPVGPHQTGGGLDDIAEYAWFQGLAGVSPVWANPALGVDPFHLVEGGGDAFDLAALADHPAVLDGDLNLGDIRFVRLVDVVGGVDVDSEGTPIWDCGNPAFAAADIDAVAGLNTNLVDTPDRPALEMELTPTNVIEITLEDPDGLWDVKTGISMALNGVPVNFYSFLHLFHITATPTKATFRIGPVPPGFDPIEMKLAVRDHSGQTSGDALAVP